MAPRGRNFSPQKCSAKKFFPILILVFGRCGNGSWGKFWETPTIPAPVEAKHKIFVTRENYEGYGFGGIAGADARCDSDANRPAGASVYKALLVAHPQRVACVTARCAENGLTEHIDWVLQPMTSYYRGDGETLIGTTDEYGLFTVSTPLTNSIGTEGRQVFTGINAAEGAWMQANDGTCTVWNSDISNAQVGLDTGTDYSAFTHDLVNCFGENDRHALYCVEQ